MPNPDASSAHGLELTNVRIAWIGPPPSDDPGVPTVARLLILALADAGHTIDVFAATGQTSVSALLGRHPRITVTTVSQNWRWGAWYSEPRAGLLAPISEQATRGIAQRRLIDALVLRHREAPYQAIYQFSQPELLGLRRWLAELPPLIVHPQVHAMGELRWHLRERKLSRQVESGLRRISVRTLLAGRALVQRRDLGLASAVIAGSDLHAYQLARDTCADRAAIYVVPNPVDLDFFTPGPRQPPGSQARILFVSRLSVRKGLELVIELSRRLRDVSDRVGLDIVGYGTAWSDYSGMLDALDSQTATFLGARHGVELRDLYRTATLCVVPSLYEPFGLTAAEALACGTPVVASSAVGAVEGIDADSVLRFPAGSLSAFETAVRSMLDRMRDDGNHIREDARAVAEAHFAPPTVARRLDDVLRAIESAGRDDSPGS